MNLGASAFWARLRENRLAYALTILATLALGILIGTVINYGVKGQEGRKSSDAAPLSVPSPQQMSNQFSQIAKQLEPSVVNVNTESTVKKHVLEIFDKLGVETRTAAGLRALEVLSSPAARG